MLKRAQENGGDQEVDAGRKEGREVQPEAGRPADSESRQPGHRCCSVTASLEIHSNVECPSRSRKSPWLCPPKSSLR